MSTPAFSHLTNTPGRCSVCSLTMNRPPVFNNWNYITRNMCVLGIVWEDINTRNFILMQMLIEEGLLHRLLYTHTHTHTCTHWCCTNYWVLNMPCVGNMWTVRNDITIPVPVSHSFGTPKSSSNSWTSLDLDTIPALIPFSQYVSHCYGIHGCKTWLNKLATILHT